MGYRRQYVSITGIEAPWRGTTYRVVKFIVKVRLMEKSVNSQVGRVMVVKVITQYRALGTTWKKKRKRRPADSAMEGR